jgi:hypothetical protein
LLVSMQAPFSIGPVLPVECLHRQRTDPRRPFGSRRPGRKRSRQAILSASFRRVRASGLQAAGNSGGGNQPGRLADPAQQPPGSLEGRPRRAIQHPHQQAVAALLRMARGRGATVKRRNRGLLLRRVGDLAEAAALGRIDGEVDKVRRYGEFGYAASSWKSSAASSSASRPDPRVPTAASS